VRRTGAPDYESVVLDEFGDGVDFDVANGERCALGPDGKVSADASLL
jgi:hypothetical protein